MKRNVLGVILARGGSKRLPRKNVLELGGKPLINWTIDEASKSKYITTLVVSTDDEEILEIARKSGVKTVIRPDVLANDGASSLDALLHAIEEIGGHYDYVILLQPTSPFRTVQNIDESLEIALTEKYSSVISVTEVEFNKDWINHLTENDTLDLFCNDKKSDTKRKSYKLNGAIYIAQLEYFRKMKKLISPSNSKAYIMSAENSIDIDSPYDFEVAKKLLK